MTAPSRRAVPTERVRFAPRDLLTATDLMDDAAAEARFRQLHVRAVHDTWGIALGFHAATSDAGTLLLVGPGFAYDACQHELVLEHAVVHAAPVPPAGNAGPEWWFDLVARDDGGRVGWRWAFAGARQNPGDEPPLLAPDVRLGVELPIARVLLNGAKKMSRVDPTHRRGARRDNARVVSGRVAAGAVLDVAVTHADQWLFTIDISSGKFTAPPFVFVALEVHPFVLRPAYAAILSTIVGPFLEVGTATKASVQVRIAFARSGGSAWSWPAEPLTQLPVGLRWVAVARPDRAEPAIVLSQARTLEGKPVPGIGGLFNHLKQFPPPGGVTP